MILFGLSALGIYLLMQHSLHTQLDRQLTRTAEDFIAETHVLADGRIESEFHNFNFDDFRPGDRAKGSFYELRDGSGALILRSRSLGPDDSLPFGSEGAERSGFEKFELSDGLKVRALLTSFPLARKGEETDGGTRAYLTIADSTSDLSRTFLILALTLAFTAVLLSLAIYFLVSRMVKRACRPIVEIAELTAGLGPDQLDSRLPCDDVPEELLPLIEKFNEFIGRLDGAIKRERRFSIDIAHEMRTPVAELRTLLEVAGDAPRDPDSNPTEIFRTGVGVAERLSSIIEVLTAIHWGETRTLPMKRGPVVLSEVLADSLGNLAAASRNRIESPPAGDETFGIQSEPALLRTVLDNLIGNAIAHSPPDSGIMIQSTANSLSIRNEAPLLCEEDLASIREPLWQKDSSRTKAQHFGLGLALVDAYLRVIGGTLRHTLDGGILTTTLELPR